MQEDKKLISYTHDEDSFPVIGELYSLMTSENKKTIKDAVRVITEDLGGNINKEFRVTVRGDGKKIYIRTSKNTIGEKNA